MRKEEVGEVGELRACRDCFQWARIIGKKRNSILVDAFHVDFGQRRTYFRWQDSHACLGYY